MGDSKGGFLICKAIGCEVDSSGEEELVKGSEDDLEVCEKDRPCCLPETISSIIAIIF